MFRATLRFITLGIVGVLAGLAFSTAEAAAPPKAPPKPAPPKHKVVHHHGRNMVTSAAPGKHRRFGVEVRAPGWQQRTFPSRVAARSFYHRLGRLHLQRSIKHHANGVTHVRFRGRHWHRYVTTTNKPAAERLAATLRTHGLHVRVRGL